MNTIKKLLKRIKELWEQSIFPEIISSIKEIQKERKTLKYLRNILPDHFNISDRFIFLQAKQIPENSDAILELKKLKILMESKGFEKHHNITSDEDSFNIKYYHEKYGMAIFYIYMDNVCDIKYVNQIVKKTKLTGLCAKVLEELNS